MNASPEAETTDLTIRQCEAPFAGFNNEQTISSAAVTGLFEEQEPTAESEETAKFQALGKRTLSDRQLST